MTSVESLSDLIGRLTQYSAETEWLEFKVNNSDHERIGQYISAISNSAALAQRDFGYILWGVCDHSHEIIGTTFQPEKEKRGNEDLEHWLTVKLNPHVGFSFHRTSVREKSVVVIKIPAANHTPVAFGHERYIRIGSYLKKLGKYPEKERLLWDLLKNDRFEQINATEPAAQEKLINLIDLPMYFKLTGLDFPDSRIDLLNQLEGHRIIRRASADSYSITNLGAIAFARDLGAFPSLKSRKLRVTFYESYSRTQGAAFDSFCSEGYAAGFSKWIDLINDRLPVDEEIRSDSLRREIRIFPKEAIRELVANALVHQSFSTGTAPMVEVFWDRIEVTNAGHPIISVDRMMDLPPQSRNEELAALFRQIGLCEQRGSGIDKIIEISEALRLPPPKFEELGECTRATLFAPRRPEELEIRELVRACYQHAVLRWIAGGQRSSAATLRERFRSRDEEISEEFDDEAAPTVDAANKATKQAEATLTELTSSAIDSALKRGLIKLDGPSSSSFVPTWATG